MFTFDSNFEQFVNLQYVMFLNLLQGELKNLSPEDRQSPAAIRAFSTGAYSKAGHFIDSLAMVAQTENDARLATLKKDLLRIVTQNAFQTIQSAKFAAQLPATQMAGAMGLLAARRVDDVGIVYRATDSAGRVWSSGLLVAFLVHDFVYQNKIDALIESAKSSGVKDVTITHLGAGNELTGKTMTLAAVIAQRHTIFHPNSASSFSYVTLPA